MIIPMNIDGYTYAAKFYHSICHHIVQRQCISISNYSLHHYNDCIDVSYNL